MDFTPLPAGQGWPISAELDAAFEAIKGEPIVYGRRYQINCDTLEITIPPTRIYFAASFHRQAEIRGYRDELLTILNAEFSQRGDRLPPPAGIAAAAITGNPAHADLAPRSFVSCAAWLDEGGKDGTEHHSPAINAPAGPAHHGALLYQCIEAIRSCDYFLCFTEPVGSPFNRGGRHIEMGAAIALGKPIIIVGPIESGAYAIPFGDGVPDHVVDRFWVMPEWDKDKAATWLMCDVLHREFMGTL